MASKLIVVALGEPPSPYQKKGIFGSKLPVRVESAYVALALLFYAKNTKK